LYQTYLLIKNMDNPIYHILNLPWIELTEAIVNLSILLIFIPLSIIMICKIRCHSLDCTSKLILISYCIAFTLRLTMDVLCITHDKCLEYDNKMGNDKLTLSLALVVSALDRLKWLVIYLFILEMRSV